MSVPSPHPATPVSVRRARLRRRSDGAIIFVTAMTLAVLASLGLYALSATRAEVRASGYMTRATMTEGIEQWGLHSAMNNLTNGPQQLVYQANSNSSYDASKAMHGCQALANVPPPSTAPNMPAATKACVRVGLDGYLASVDGAAPPIMWSLPGRGYQATVDLFTEMTNVDQSIGQPIGFGLNTSYFRIVTLTSYGILRINNGITTGSSSEIVHQGRGHLIIGPISSNGNTPAS